MAEQVCSASKPKRMSPMQRCATETKAREAKRLAAWVAEMDAMPLREGQCYFFGIDNGPIKIGYSNDPGRRVMEIALQVHQPLTVLATLSGGRYREAHYHKMFAAHRIRGEWFERCPEIEAEIARLSGAAA